MEGQETPNPNIGIGQRKPTITESLLVLAKERDAARKKFDKYKTSKSNLIMAYREREKYEQHNNAIEILMKYGNFPKLDDLEETE